MAGVDGRGEKAVPRRARPCPRIRADHLGGKCQITAEKLAELDSQNLRQTDRLIISDTEVLGG